MTRITKTEKCTCCGQKKGLTLIEDLEICRECRSLLEKLQNNREAAGKLFALAGLCQNSQSSAAPPSTTEKIRELPDVLDAVRYRTTDRDRNTWYVSVSELDENPVEIFASTAFDRDHHLQSRISNLTTITRLISLILRHVFLGENLTLEKTLTQLRRSSRQKNDLPDMLAQVLSNYAEKNRQPTEKEVETP
jgi:hypothetical protein